LVIFYAFMQMGVIGFLDGGNDHLFKVESMDDQTFHLHIEGPQ
jgi:hypothetical protein